MNTEKITQILPTLHSTVADTLSEITTVEVMRDNIQGTDHAFVLLRVSGKMKDGATIKKADSPDYVHKALGKPHSLSTEKPKPNGVSCPNCRSELFDTIPG